MKKILLGFITTIVLSACCTGATETKVIAHRGFWNTKESAQNSIQSLKLADSNNFFGSECDVWITSDNQLIMYHDDNYTNKDGIVKRVDETSFDEMRKITLKNGEILPSYEEYLQCFKQCNKTKLIIELKVPQSLELKMNAVKLAVELVDKYDLTNKVEYISFDLDMCKELARIAPKNTVSYLEGDLSPQQLKEFGITGINYHHSVYKKNPTWIKESKGLGLVTNVWTVNKVEDIKYFIQEAIDYITTDEPMLATTLLHSSCLNRK